MDRNYLETKLKIIDGFEVVSKMSDKVSDKQKVLDK